MLSRSVQLAGFVSPQHLLQDVLSDDGLLLGLEYDPLLLLPLVPATQSVREGTLIGPDPHKY